VRSPSRQRCSGGLRPRRRGRPRRAARRGVRAARRAAPVTAPRSLPRRSGSAPAGDDDGTGTPAQRALEVGRQRPVVVDADRLRAQAQGTDQVEQFAQPGSSTATRSPGRRCAPSTPPRRRARSNDRERRRRHVVDRQALGCPRGESRADVGPVVATRAQGDPREPGQQARIRVARAQVARVRWTGRGAASAGSTPGGAAPASPGGRRSRRRRGRAAAGRRRPRCWD
jgi:hypothetical protein